MIVVPCLRIELYIYSLFIQLIQAYLKSTFFSFWLQLFSGHFGMM
jgi:hypothetical protein